MAQRTRTTTTRVALAGAAMILGAGLTGCMNDGKKPIKPIGPPATQTQTKMGGQPGFPSGPGQYPPAGSTVAGQTPGAGLGSTFPGTAQPAGLMTPGQPGTVGVPTRMTGASAGAGAPMMVPGSFGAQPQGASPYAAPAAGAATNPTYTGGSSYQGMSGSNYAPEMSHVPTPPPAPSSGFAPSVAPYSETTPPAATNYPLPPAGGPQYGNR